MVYELKVGDSSILYRLFNIHFLELYVLLAVF